MNILLFIMIYALVVLMAWGLTAWARQYALQQQILDHPNHRSSHSVPTPRGGGISIVVIMLLAILLLWLTNYFSLQLALAIGGGGVLVAGVGWLDDRYNVLPVWRAASYLLAAIWTVCLMTDIYGMPVGNSFVVYGLMVLAITWLINLYNFMDGTDGLAATEAICVAVPAAVMLLLAGQTGLAALLFVLSAACAGFLIWNWPPASIFMGDIGSCLTGFMLGTVALAGVYTTSISPTVWLILLAIFIGDASLTLAKRILNRERWYAAHRSHAYQLLVQAGYSHRQLLIMVIAVNTLLLLPLACVASYSEVGEWWITTGVYVFIGSLWLLIQLKYAKAK